MIVVPDFDQPVPIITEKPARTPPLIIWSAPVAWLSRRQQLVATSSMEAEYIAMYYVTQDIICFRALLIGLENMDPSLLPTIIFHR
jgi:hypothetical protein